MTLPVSTVRSFDSLRIKVHVPGRGPGDLVEVWISRPPGERRTHVLICNGYEEVADHWVDDR
jgi:hypothetical protein